MTGKEALTTIIALQNYGMPSMSVSEKELYDVIKEDLKLLDDIISNGYWDNDDYYISITDLELSNRLEKHILREIEQ